MGCAIYLCIYKKTIPFTAATALALTTAYDWDCHILGNGSGICLITPMFLQRVGSNFETLLLLGVFSIGMQLDGGLVSIESSQGLAVLRMV